MIKLFREFSGYDGGGPADPIPQEVRGKIEKEAHFYAEQQALSLSFDGVYSHIAQNERYNNARIHFLKIAEFSYSLALPRIKELEQENERLREAVKKAEESEVDTPDLCDVDGCEMEAASGGCAWRESGYWRVCLDHSARARAGSPQPFMKKSATDREKSRLPNGRLPTQALAGKKEGPPLTRKSKQ